MVAEKIRERCIAKVGEPFRMRECHAPVEYVAIHDMVYRGTAMATSTGWYHLDSGHDHHAVPESWVK
jgi:hypothetical protein